MRITGGNAKGRILKSPRGMDIRPTSDKVREATFNIIGHDLSGLTVLDLFAGTGSLGLEALSRKAEHAVFVDCAQQAIKLIKENLLLCGYQDMGTVLRRDLKKGLPLSHEVPRPTFDLVFLDPPYGRGFITPLMEKLSTQTLLSKEARVITELSKSETTTRSMGSLQLKDTRIYGDTQINLYLNEVIS